MSSIESINEFIGDYFRFKFDGNVDFGSEDTIEEDYDIFVEEYFNGDERFDAWVDGYIKLKDTKAQVILDMIEVVEEYAIDCGINPRDELWGNGGGYGYEKHKKTIREIYHKYAYSFVMTEREMFLEIFNEEIDHFKAQKEEEEEEDEQS
jgi:hypothetical protein